MRRDELYLRDIVEAAAHIESFISGLQFTTFEETELLRSAVTQKLTVIGEACARIPADLKARHPEVPWPKAAAFRNILVHAYFGLDWAEVWLAATKQVPVLRDQVASIIAQEFGQ